MKDEEEPLDGEKLDTEPELKPEEPTLGELEKLELLECPEEEAEEEGEKSLAL